MSGSLSLKEGKMWKRIPGSSKEYEASIDGKIRRKIKPGVYNYLKPYIKKRKSKGTTAKHEIVRIDSKEEAVHRIVYRTFRGPIPDGYCVYHKNGLVTKNDVYNLKLITKRELGKITGSSSKRKPVLKISREGNIVECYSSARAAARENNMSYQTIIDRCNEKAGKRSVFAPDGYVYVWDDNIKALNRAIRRIESEILNNIYAA